MSIKCQHSGNPKDPISNFSLEIVESPREGIVLELLHPGSFVTLDNQPNDLPPFQVINCKAGRCFVRQQSWGKYVRWEVDHSRLQSA